MVDDEVMSTQEATEFLKVSRGTLMKCVQDGIIPAQKIGRQWRFSKRALLNWLERGQAQKEDK